MWILGNLFSKNPTILYTIDNDKQKKENTVINKNIYVYNNITTSNNNPLIEDTEHLKRFFGMR